VGSTLGPCTHVLASNIRGFWLSLPNEPRWLTPEEVIELNKLIVESTGETFLVRDYGLLESACNRPRNLYLYEGAEDVVTLAARLLFGIAQAHAFEQGNKRAAFEAALVFMCANGYELTLPDSEEFAHAVIAVIEHESDEAGFEAALREYVVPLTG